jgi:hypothetical protein
MTDSYMRTTPQTELDLQMMLTDPKWGIDASPELKQKLTKILGYVQTQENKLEAIEEELWGLLSMYTRDIRLGNLSQFYGEVEYVQYYLDLAGDCLREGYTGAFMKSLSMAITVLEVSQSRGGFLRKRQNTVTQEQYKEEKEPQKQSLWGKKKQEY